MPAVQGRTVLGEGLSVPELILLRLSVMPQVPALGLATLLVVSDCQLLPVLQCFTCLLCGGGPVLGLELNLLGVLRNVVLAGCREPASVLSLGSAYLLVMAGSQIPGEGNAARVELRLGPVDLLCC